MVCRNLNAGTPKGRFTSTTSTVKSVGKHTTSIDLSWPAKSPWADPGVFCSDTSRIALIGRKNKKRLARSIDPARRFELRVKPPKHHALRECWFGRDVSTVQMAKPDSPEFVVPRCFSELRPTKTSGNPEAERMPFEARMGNWRPEQEMTPVAPMLGRTVNQTDRSELAAVAHHRLHPGNRRHRSCKVDSSCPD